MLRESSPPTSCRHHALESFTLPPLSNAPTSSAASPKHESKGENTRAAHSVAPHSYFSQIQKMLRSNALIHRGVAYASLHEAACADMLEKHVRGFRIVEGLTYQIPVFPPGANYPKTIDFFVNGHFIEFHPPRFWRDGKKYGDFATPADYFAFVKKRAQCTSSDEKAKFVEATRKELQKAYASKREGFINSDPRTAGTPLIVASDREEFYDKVIVRFASRPPTREDFFREFDELIRALAANNPQWRSSTRPKALSQGDNDAREHTLRRAA